MKPFFLLASLGILGSPLQAAPEPAPASKPPQRQNQLELPEIARQDVICFAYYTVHRGVLKLTAQLYPLQNGESRETRLEVQEDGVWNTMARSRVTEDDYHNYRNDKTWTAHFRVEPWDETRTTPYRVVALDGGATYAGTIRANPVGQREIVVAAFTGNSSNDRRLKPDLIANLKAQDPDLLFFSGDQVYDHKDHLRAWLLFGRQFGEIIRDRPMVSIPDDHDVGQANLWGAGGKVASTAAGDDGGYFMPAEYVRAVERAQTWHLPDPVDPAPIERGLGVYFTALDWGGINFAILEDRKFKTGPNGPLHLVPDCAPRPDWVTNAHCDPQSLDLPGLVLLGQRQENFLRTWGEDWTDAEFKVVLSQTIFSYATHISHGNRLLADLDSNGWPQSGRRRAVDLMRRCFAFHICGDQHLGCVAQYGLDDWRDASLAFCVPSIVNYYPRKWLPLDPAVQPLPGPLPHLGDYTEGFGNKLTMFAYANPTAFPAPLDNLAASASGHGLIRFDKQTRQITLECWPREVDVTQPGAQQYPGWPRTLAQADNYRRTAVAWLPRLHCDVENPVVQVVDEANGEVVYTLRIRGREYSPGVFHAGTYTLRVGEGTQRREFTGLASQPEPPTTILEVNLPSPPARSLFNGQDLTGWVVMHGGEWTVEDGMLVGRNGRDWTTNPELSGSWLRTDREYGDFILELEYAIEGNSGILLRSALEKNPSFTGYEMQVLSDHGRQPSKGSAGSLYDVVAATQNMSKPAGEWNQVRIHAQGPRIRITWNGVETVDFAQATRSASGYIGLQNHDERSVVKFRNLRITEL